MKLFDYSGKNVVITGGASGIGLAMSKLFARCNAAVYILDLDGKMAAQAVAAIQAQNGKAVARKVDLSDHNSVVQLLQEINKEAPIQVLVNNAGTAHIGNAINTNEEDFTRLFNINVKSVYSCMHAVLPAMLQQGGGVILNLASIAASVGIVDRFAYSMTKGAIKSMTLSVARDFIKNNIRCNCISPARVHTPFVDGFLKKNYPGQESDMFEKLSQSQPIGRMAKPDEVAYLALYLCSEEAGFITGCDYPIDGGFIHLNN